MRIVSALVFVFMLALPVSTRAAEARGDAEETPVNHALVAAIAAMEGTAMASHNVRLDNLALAVAGLEADGPWHGNLTYRAQFVDGGPYDGFDHGVQLGLGYQEYVMPNLLLKFDMLLDREHDLFTGRFGSDESRLTLDEAYFKFSQ